MATPNPWYGYKRIAVMCRRAGQAVKDRQAYVVMRDHGLLHKPKPREAEVYQAAKLFELLPQQPNDLWQMDVTYVHIPGYSWYYAVTVIGYYSCYLLACHLTHSYSALEAAHALKLARQEAERLCGPLTKRPFLVTDNGSSFIAKRFVDFVRDQYSHVRIRYRTPKQLGLLELVGDHNPREHEFSVQLRAYDASNAGQSLGVAALLAMCSALINKSLRGGLVIVGGLNLGGSLDVLHNAIDVVELAVETGASLVLIPVSARKQLFDLSDDMATKVNVLYYGDVREAFVKAIAD